LDKLIMKYIEPHRRYHNLAHIGYMFQQAHEIGSPVNPYSNLYYAIWFHDAIYDCFQTDNEYASARYWSEREPFLPFYGNVDTVYSMILSTIHHTKDQDLRTAADLDTQILLDLDIASLAKPYEEYLNDSKNIRAEYSFLTEEKWREGRMKWASTMLQRERLYYTDNAYEKWEKAARQNLTRTLEELQ
jgi:predicted metal-dependent HD superfamily phosphohydrolase